jgi:vitamin B12 transporter
VADLLQGEAGFEFGRNGGPGTVTSFFLRGQNSVSVAIYVDGVRSQVDSIGTVEVREGLKDKLIRVTVVNDEK